MKQSEIKKLFGSPTYDISPENFEQGQAGRYVYERWSATIWDRTLHGVTVLHDNGTGTDLSETFDTRLGADLYIKNLGRKT